MNQLIVKFKCFIVISYAHFKKFATLDVIKTKKRLQYGTKLSGYLRRRIYIIAPLYAVSGVCGQAFVFF